MLDRNPTPASTTNSRPSSGDIAIAAMERMTGIAPAPSAGKRPVLGLGDGRFRLGADIRRLTRRAHEARRVRHGGGEQRDESIVGIPDARPRDPVDGAGHDVTALPHGHARRGPDRLPR